MGLTAYNRRRRLKAEKLKPIEKVEEPKYTIESLKELGRSEQCVICKKLGLKGYTTVKEDVRIKMILKA